MGTRGLLIATALLAVLGGLVFWSNREKAKEEGKPPSDASPKIVSLQEGDLTQLDLKRRDGTETIIKKNASGKWGIIAPKPIATDNDAVIQITNTFAGLASDRVVEDKAGDLSGYGLNPPALDVTVTKKDGKTQKILIGDDTPTGGSVYVMASGDPRVFTMSTSLKTSIDKTWQDLRDKRLLTFEQEKLTGVVLDAKKSSVQFGKNNQNEWTIVKPKPMRADGWQVEELIRKLKEAKMDTAVSEEDAKKAAASFATGTPVSTVKVSDASGTQTLDIRKVKDDYYAKSSVVDGVYKVAADLGTSTDKTMDDFRNKKLFDFGFSEPSKIEVKNGDKSAAYGKSGEKWFAGPKQIDSTSLQNFIDKLRDLAATKFVETGFTTQVFEVTVVSNEGKRTEKVQISKSGADYFARRDNEPAIYQLDPKAADDLIKTSADVKEAQPEKKK